MEIKVLCKSVDCLAQCQITGDRARLNSNELPRNTKQHKKSLMKSTQCAICTLKSTPKHSFLFSHYKPNTKWLNQTLFRSLGMNFCFITTVISYYIKSRGDLLLQRRTECRPSQRQHWHLVVNISNVTKGPAVQTAFHVMSSKTPSCSVILCKYTFTSELNSCHN